MGHLCNKDIKNRKTSHPLKPSPREVNLPNTMVELRFEPKQYGSSMQHCFAKATGHPFLGLFLRHDAAVVFSKKQSSQIGET